MACSCLGQSQVPVTPSYESSNSAYSCRASVSKSTRPAAAGNCCSYRAVLAVAVDSCCCCSQSSMALMRSASSKHRTLSQVPQSLSHPFHSSSAAPPQRVMSVTTTNWSAMQRTASQSTQLLPSAVRPPQVNLLNRLLISHCFQHQVLSPLISMNYR